MFIYIFRIWREDWRSRKRIIATFNQVQCTPGDFRQKMDSTT